MPRPSRPRSQPRRRTQTRRPPWWRQLETDLAKLRQIQIGQLLERKRRQVFALILLALFTGILLLALVPGQRRFEVQVVATQFSFDTALPGDEPQRRFLDSIRDLESLSLTGRYPEAVTLTGQFTNESLGNFSELTLEMPYDDSLIRFEPVVETDTDFSSGLAVLELHLQNQMSVEAEYVPFSRRMELRFTHAIPPNSDQERVLELYLGQRPLQMTLEGYRLSVAGQTLEDPEGNQPLSLTFQPDIPELALLLPETGSLSLALPSLSNIDTLRWFWGNLPVSQIAFTTEEFRRGDSLVRSSILSGLVRMGDQKIDIEADQFLLLKNPGIQRIRYLKLIEDEGIEVRAMGTTALAQVGLDPDFPVRSLRSNIIARVFRPDVVVAIVSFSGAMVATLLGWFVDNLFQSPAEED